ncbi:MAG: 3-dehydroquinate synthase, partial [Clostridia bacterium]|nr:3-dehydroquinate synthase [Clostridia bacterium]
MTEFTLKTPSSNCKIVIGEGLLTEAGHLADPILKGRTAAVVTDENVGPLHARALRGGLESAGFAVKLITLPAGEEYKRLETVSRLYDFFLSSGLTRSDAVFALGGGVVGDMAGFAAATYMRGVPVVQLPTTLLAQVDSSIGGKTGVDLPRGKNLVGAFHQPLLVVADTDTLKTLPEPVFKDGMAEVLKYGYIRDAALLRET